MRPSNTMRTTALCASLSLLTACATPSSPGKIEEPAPKAPDPRICAALEKEPPVLGEVVQPTTQAERDALADFLGGEAEARSWGRRGWERAKLARDRECSGS
jgi:hypothetical protein